MIIGNLGRDPELRYTQTGSPVATLNIATDEGYTDKEGNKVERTEWHRVSVFQRSAENCSQFLSKGSKVYVEGRLTTRKWQDQQGQDRYSTEIRAERVQFLDRKGERNMPEMNEGFNEQAPTKKAPAKRQQSNDNNESFGSSYPSEASDMDDSPF